MPVDRALARISLGLRKEADFAIHAARVAKNAPRDNPAFKRKKIRDRERGRILMITQRRETNPAPVSAPTQVRVSSSAGPVGRLFY